MNKATAHFETKLAFETDSSDLFEALNLGQAITVIDTRLPVAFSNEHIPGAVNFPHRTMNEETTRPLDKSRVYVAYCDGIGCNASTKGALNLAKLGFNVRELIGGIEWWKKDGFATEGKLAVKNGLKLSCYC